MNFNHKSWFTGYREAFGSLNQQQVDGLEFLLGAIEKDPEWESIQDVSYFLATVQHETARTFQPIKEIREQADSPRRANQDRYWLTGYYGRGYIQLTWRKNYKKFGIENDPDKALEADTAYRIASEGMRQGSFTGKKLSEFINENETDYVNARKVVNGLDRAEHIAKIARNLEAILSVAAQDAVQVPIAPKPTKPEPVKPEPEKQPEPQPPVTTIPGHPPVIEVKTQKVSWTTKIAAVLGPVGTFFTTIGLKVGGVQFTQSVILALIAAYIVTVIVGAWLYNEGKNRADRRQQHGMNNLADPNRANVVAGNGA